MNTKISFNPEQLKSKNIINDYHDYGSIIEIIFKNNEKRFFKKENDRFVEFFIPKDFIISEISNNEYIIIKNQNSLKYGYYNINDGSTINPEYDECTSFNEGLAVVCKNGKYGIINKNKEIILPIVFDDCNCSEGMIIAKNSGKSAYFDKNGKQLTEYDYITLNPFKNGLTEYKGQIVDINLKPLFASTEILYSDFDNKEFIYNCGADCLIYPRGELYLNNYFILEGITRIEHLYNGLKIDKIISVKKIKQDNSNVFLVKARFNYDYYGLEHRRGQKEFDIIFEGFEKILRVYDPNKTPDYIIYPVTEGDPIYLSSPNGEYSYSPKTKLDISCNGKKDFTPFNNGYSFIKPNGIRKEVNFILINNKGEKICDTNYIEFVNNLDNLYIFKTNIKTYTIVDNENNKVIEVPINGDKTIFNYKDTPYSFDPYFHSIEKIKEAEKKEESSLNKTVKFEVKERNNPLLGTLPNKYIEIENINQDDLTEEEKLLFQIETYLLKYDNDKLNQKYNEIINKYRKESQEIIEKDLEKRKNPSVTLTLTPTTTNSKEYYKQYIKQLTNYLNRLKNAENIYNRINTIKESKQDEKENQNDELIKDINKLRNLYKELNDKLRIKNENLLNDALDKEKEKLINSILDDDSKKFNNIEAWDNSFRTILHSLIVQYKDDYQLNILYDQINSKQEILNNVKNSYYDGILGYVKRINDIVKHIESSTDDGEIINKLQKFKNIKIDLNKELNENISYIFSLFEEVIKLEVYMEYTYEPLSYQSSNRFKK